MLTYYSAPLSLLLLAALAGCAGAPQKTQQERLATLNVYEDNTVALSFNDGKGKVHYAVQNDPGKIVAFELNGTLYNARDIARIYYDKPVAKSPVEVTMKDGSMIVLPSAASPTGKQLVRMEICDRLKNCLEWEKIPLKNVEDKEELDDRTIDPHLRWHKESIKQELKVFWVLPYPRDNTYAGHSADISIITGDEVQRLSSQFLAKEDFDKEVVAQIIAKRKAQEEEWKSDRLKAKMAESARQQKAFDNAPVGTQMLCESGVIPHYETSIEGRYNCSSYGTHLYSNLVKQGWLVVSQTKRDFDNILVQGVILNLTFKKVR